MKSIATSVLLLTLIVTGYSQSSKSYHAIREKFQGQEEVFAMRTSGFLARTVLAFAGEYQYKEAIRDVREIRFVVIPKRLFERENVSLKGFVKFTKKDGFDELVHVKDHGDDVTLLLQTTTKSKLNRYLLVVDSSDEVVVMEIRGYVDPEILLKNERYTYNQY